jgi:septum formation inhibitor MinC
MSSEYEPPRHTIVGYSANSSYPQDLEEVEEWNEFGELRMIVNSVQDVDGMPATSYPLPVSESPAPAPTTPKPSTIKIQSPPATRPEEKKDEQAVLALRQASSEAADKAKSKAEEKKTESKPEPKEEDTPPQSSSPSKTHRGSVAPELPDIAPDSPAGTKRPPLIPEVAAVSSANFHVDNAVELGLVEHHRGSIISASDNADKDKIVTEIRQSISGAEAPGGSLDALRKEAAERPQDESIVEEGPIVEEAEKEEQEEKAENVKEEKKKEDEKKVEPSETKASKEESSTTAQDTKAAEETTAKE